MSDHGSHGDECRALVARLSEYLDDELPDDICSSIERHFADCPPCREFLDSLRNTVGWLRASPAPGMPDEARDELRRLLAVRRPPRP